MYYTITRPGDTWLSLAREHYGSRLKPSVLQQFIALNQPGFLWGSASSGAPVPDSYSVSQLLPPGEAVWLPDEYCSIPFIYQSIKRDLNSGPLQSKPNLARLESAGISPKYAVAAKVVTHQIKQALGNGQEDTGTNSTFAATGLDFSLVFAGQLLDRAAEITTDAVKEIKSLQEAMRLHFDSPSYAEEIRPYYLRANKALNKAVAQLAFACTHFNLDRSLRHADAYAAFGGRGFSVLDSDDARKLLYTAHSLRLVNYGMTAMDVGFRIDKVFDVYMVGGNWKKETGVQSAEYVLDGVAGKTVARGAAAVMKNLLPFGNSGIPEGAAFGIDIAEGVTLAALGPEIAIALITTTAIVGINYLVEEFSK